jgi:hygromycin-B 7''-O-kinase
MSSIDFDHRSSARRWPGARALADFRSDFPALMIPATRPGAPIELFGRGWFLPGLVLQHAIVGERERIEIVSRLGAALKHLHEHTPPLSDPALNHDWREFIERQAQTCVERQRDCGANPEWLESLPAYVAARLPLLPAGRRPALLHGDVHLGNLLLAQENGGWKISGLFDFGDSLCGFHEYEFVAPGVLMTQGNSRLQRAFLLAYGYKESDLDLSLRARLMLLTVLYECSNLRKYAMRLTPEAVNFTLNELESAIWKFAAE